MLAILCAQVADATQIVAVESAFAVPLVDQATGAVLDRDLVGTLDLVERDADGRLVVVDLKTAARKYSDLRSRPRWKRANCRQSAQVSNRQQ